MLYLVPTNSYPLFIDCLQILKIIMAMDRQDVHADVWPIVIRRNYLKGVVLLQRLLDSPDSVRTLKVRHESPRKDFVRGIMG